MNLFPTVFALVAANMKPLQVPITWLSIQVPRGSVFRLDNVLIEYNRTVVEGVQSSPELQFEIFDSRGLALENGPVFAQMITGPAGGKNVGASWYWGVEYQPGEVISARITNMAAGPVPATISVTYLGQKGPGKR